MKLCADCGHDKALRVTDAADRLRRLADAAEGDCHCDYPMRCMPCRARLEMMQLGFDGGQPGVRLARCLADEHETLLKALARFEAYTPLDIETTFKAEAHRILAATDQALAALGDTPCGQKTSYYYASARIYAPCRLRRGHDGDCAL